MSQGQGLEPPSPVLQSDLQGNPPGTGEFPQAPSLINRLRAQTMPIEDSWLLRILVQLLVTVGILATDRAAADVVDALGLAWWAIPASWVGASVSGVRRNQRNIGLKFAIALGMLVALGVFFTNLLSRQYDTRIVLVELLIHLQVLHSFDLPRRKDLGYSMVIGLILLSVAATLSQTLSFAIFLVLFLAIALPVLVLDYMSRLSLLQSLDWGKGGLGQLGAEITPRRLGTLLLVVSVLGLSIFVLLPRLPGYQLRALPVSAPIDVQGRFDNRQVLNPGYQQNSETGSGSGGTSRVQGSGGSPVRGPGQADDQVYYGFNTQINQNLRGELKPKLVMRVRSQLEGYWRVMAFDRYTGQGWEVSRNSKTLTLVRSPWSYRFDLPPKRMGRNREIIQTITMVSEFPNLIPVLHEARELYFPTEEIAVDAEGGLRSPVPLSDGLTYSAVSRVPYRDRTALGQTGQRYPEQIRRYYLQVPEAIAPRLRQRATDLLATADKPITAPYEQALFLSQALKQRYSVLPDLPFLGENEDLTEAFLFKNQGGAPDHFSTTLTLMLRSLGIPARLAVGFGPGQFNPFTGYYLVRNTDAYATTEVYFPNAGWFAFDPIPGHDLYPPALEESTAFSTLRAFWQWVAGWLPSPVRNGLSGVVLWVAALLSRGLSGLLGLLSQGLVGIFVGLFLALLLGFGGWLGWLGWQRWRYQRWLRQLPPVEQVYQRLLQALAEAGSPRVASQTPYEYLESLAERQPPETIAIAQDISEAYVAWRYGDRPTAVQPLTLQMTQLERLQAQNQRRQLLQRLRSLKRLPQPGRRA